MIVRTAHRLLVILDLIVAVTAIAGGTVLVISALVPSWSTVLAPPREYLEGSPFASYLVPGLALAAVLGGLHLAAAVLLLRRSRLQFIGATVAGYAMLIWIFVQMIVARRLSVALSSAQRVSKSRREAPYRNPPRLPPAP